MSRDNRIVNERETHFDVRDESGKKTISGYFAVFGSDYNIGPGMSESVDAHAFDGAMNDDVRVLMNHDTTLVLGRTTAGTARLRVDDHGLYGEVDINEADSDAMNAWARVQRGDVSQCSFGFDILDEDCTFRDDGSTHWTIKAVRLYEVSVCTFPAYSATSVSARADDREAAKKAHVDAWAGSLIKRLEVCKCCDN